MCSRTSAYRLGQRLVGLANRVSCRVEPHPSGVPPGSLRSRFAVLCLLIPTDLVSLGATIIISPSYSPIPCSRCVAMAGSNTFCWNELNTKDAAACKTFYGAVFGWTATDQPFGPMTYT